ncbi:MAG: histone deacetylase [Pseudomonadota bacterium]
MLPIVYHPDYMAPLRQGHRFPMSKYGYLRDHLQRLGLLKSGGFVSPAPAALRVLELAHTPDYVDRTLSLTQTADEVRRIGLPNTERVVRRSRLSAAGTTLAGWLALEHGIACNAAGGSHHAAAGHGAGFCVFNDVAVAARTLLAQGVEGPFLVVDADVHQGDGTARIFEGDDLVRTLSVHAAKNFPARKAVSDVDLALPDGVEDAAYLDALGAALRNELAVCPPRLAFYNAGVDVHHADKLGRLALTDQGIRARDRLVLSTLRGAGVPVVGVLGGGYADNPDDVAARHALMFGEAAALAD